MTDFTALDSLKQLHTLTLAIAGVERYGNPENLAAIEFIREQLQPVGQPAGLVSRCTHRGLGDFIEKTSGA